MNPAAPSPLPAVPERIAAVIYGLCQTLTARLRVATVTPAQLTYIVGRLLGIRRRFQTLVARIRAGNPPRERARKPRAAKPAPDPDFPLGFRPPPRGWRRWAVRPDKPVPLWRALGQDKFAWLLPLAPAVAGFRASAAFHRAELLGFLAEPDIQALLWASRRVGDSLRPLCWMLGIEVSVLYPARPAATVPDGAPDALASAPGRAAFTEAPFGGDRGPNPVAGEEISCRVATAVPVVSGLVGPPGPRPRARDGGDFFATA